MSWDNGKFWREDFLSFYVMWRGRKTEGYQLDVAHYLEGGERMAAWWWRDLDRL